MSGLAVIRAVSIRFARSRSSAALTRQRIDRARAQSAKLYPSVNENELALTSISI
jgi:hypothetical protein